MGWRLVYVDSEEVAAEDGRAINAFDGDPSTLWHTQWKDSQPPLPHEIQIDLGAVYSLEGFSYLPRQDGNTHGRIKDYEFYVSNDPSNWGNPVVAGTLVNQAAAQDVMFSAPATGRYIRLRALSEVNGNNSWTSMAELNLTGSASSGNLAPNGVIDTPAGNVTIAKGGTVIFTSTGSDPEGATSLHYQWDFGASGIADSTAEDPGTVAFNTPGTYTVTLTVIDSSGVSDPSPATRTITVQDQGISGVIPQSDWSLVYVDSAERGGQGSNAFDGDPSTVWHTQWRGSHPPPPHEIQIDLGAVYNLEGFRYLPRQDGGNQGRIGLYAFYVSLDGKSWDEPVAAGRLANTPLEKRVSFKRVPGRYIRLVALTTANQDPFTNVAELNVEGALQVGNLPPQGHIGMPAKNVTMGVGQAIDFMGTGNDPEGASALHYQWDFGSSGIAPSTAQNPSVQFTTPGTYTVTLTVRDGAGAVDPYPAQRVVKVLGSAGEERLEQADWALKFVDSQETVGEDGRGVNAFDNNPSTLWHSQWQAWQTPPPHEIQIDLGSAIRLDTLHYLPRQDGNTNGRIKDYALYVSGNGTDWGVPVALASFANTGAEKAVLFPPKMGRFIRLVALNEVNDKPFTSAAEINLEGQCQTPYLQLAQPLDQWVQQSADLKVSVAVCLNQSVHPGWGVKIELDGGLEKGGAEALVTTPPYRHTFKGVGLAEHSLKAFLVDGAGQPAQNDNPHDQVTQVGIGDYYVAIGDSITAGVGDNITTDNHSRDGRNIESGYTPLLNDLLTTATGYPHTVIDKGVPGVTSAEGLRLLPDVINRHPRGEFYLIMYGTNDSAGMLPVPSGLGLEPGNAGYPGSYKDIMQQIIDLLKAAGKQPYLAKVPYTLKGSTRNDLIAKYNQVIDELVTKNHIPVTPPDFFSYFQNHQKEFSDTLHPNGSGYQAMARLWSQALQ